MISELRPYQRDALTRLRQSLGSGKRRPIVQAATGAGKTVLAAAIVDGALSKGNRVVFAVPALSLIDQTVQAFWREGIQDVGVIQADHPLTDWSKPVQVASVQTLDRRARPDCQVVVWDECHRLSKTMLAWMHEPGFERVPFIGLSATPWTKGLGRHFDDLVIAATTAELIEQGYLSPFRVFAPSHPDLSGVKTVAGDYHEGQLSEVMREQTLVADVVTTWLERARGLPTLVFGVDCAHAQALQARFQEAGVRAGYQDAHTDALERERIRRAFHNGDLEVVCNVGTLTTGVDWDVRCIVLARPTKSEMLFVQIVGRGLRTAAGKSECLILDHSDTTLRLGFVTDIIHDTLDDGKAKKSSGDRERAEPLPKECPSCAYLKPPRVHECPNCGFKPAKPDGVIEVDGELVEMTPASKGKRKGKREWTDAEKRVFFQELMGIVEERGYKPGYAAMKFKDRFGDWPPRRWNDLPAFDPSPATRSWVRSQQIRWAKSQKREGQRDAA